MSFDHVSDVYDKTRIIPRDVLTTFYTKIMARGIVLNKSSIVLDAGVGTGRTIDPLLDLDVRMVGVDISRKMLRKMIEKLKGNSKSKRVNLILADVTMLPFRTHTFDLIVSIHVLHLVKKWRKAVREAKRVLKPKGRFAAATHGAPDLISKVGQKYFALCNKYGIPHAKGIRGQLSRIANEVFSHKKIRFLERFSKIVLEHNSFLGIGGEMYLRRQSVSMEQCIIIWKEILDINEIFARLNNRIISKQWRIPTTVHEKVMFELGKWRDKEVKKDGPFEKVTREFKFFSVQF